MDEISSNTNVSVIANDNRNSPSSKKSAKSNENKYPGLSFILFVKSRTGNDTDLWFECILCAPGSKMLPKEMTQHLRSPKHLYNLMGVECPKFLINFTEDGDSQEMLKCILEYEASQGPPQVMTVAHPDNIADKRAKLESRINTMQLNFADAIKQRALQNNEWEGDDDEDKPTIQSGNFDWEKDDDDAEDADDDADDDKDDPEKSSPDPEKSSPGQNITSEEDTKDDNSTKPEQEIVTNSEESNENSMDADKSQEEDLEDAEGSSQPMGEIKEEFPAKGSQRESSKAEDDDNEGKRAKLFEELQLDNRGDEEEISHHHLKQTSALDDNAVDMSDYEIFQKGFQGMQFIMNCFESLVAFSRRILRFSRNNVYFGAVEKGYVGKFVDGRVAKNSVKMITAEEFQFLIGSMNSLYLDHEVLSYRHKPILPVTKLMLVCQQYHDSLHHPDAITLFEIISREFFVFPGKTLTIIEKLCQECSICTATPEPLLKAHSYKVLEAYNEWPNKREVKALNFNIMTNMSYSRNPSRLVIIGDERDEALKSMNLSDVSVRICPGLNLENAYDFISCDSSFGQGVLFVVLCGTFTFVRWEVDKECLKLGCPEPLLVPSVVKLRENEPYNYAVNAARNLHQSVMLNSQKDDVIFGHVLPIAVNSNANYLAFEHQKKFGHTSTHPVLARPQKEFYISLNIAMLDYNGWTDRFASQLGYCPWNLSAGFFAEVVQNKKRYHKFNLGKLIDDGVNFTSITQDIRLTMVKELCKDTLSRLQNKEKNGLLKNFVSMENPLVTRTLTGHRFEKILIFCESDTKILLQGFGSSQVLITDAEVIPSVIEGLCAQYNLRSINTLWIFTSSVRPVAQRLAFQGCPPNRKCNMIKMPFLAPRDDFMVSNKAAQKGIKGVINNVKNIIDMTKKIVGSNCVAIVAPVLPVTVVNVDMVDHDTLHRLFNSLPQVFVSNNAAIKKLLPLYDGFRESSVELAKDLFIQQGFYPIPLTEFKPRLRGSFRSLGRNQTNVPFVSNEWQQMMKNLIYTSLNGFPAYIPPTVEDHFLDNHLRPDYLDKHKKQTGSLRFNRVVFIASKQFNELLDEFTSPLIQIINIDFDDPENEIADALLKIQGLPGKSLCIYIADATIITDQIMSSTVCELNHCLSSFECIALKNKTKFVGLSNIKMVEEIVKIIHSQLSTVADAVNGSSFFIVAPLCPIRGLLVADYPNKLHIKLHTYYRKKRTFEFLDGEQSEWVEAGEALDKLWPYVMESFKPNIGVPYKIIIKYDVMKEGSFQLLTQIVENLDHFYSLSAWKSTLVAFIDLCLKMRKDGKFTEKSLAPAMEAPPAPPDMLLMMGHTSSVSEAENAESRPLLPPPIPIMESAACSGMIDPFKGPNQASFHRQSDDRPSDNKPWVGGPEGPFGPAPGGPGPMHESGPLRPPQPPVHIGPPPPLRGPPPPNEFMHRPLPPPPGPLQPRPDLVHGPGPMLRLPHPPMPMQCGPLPPRPGPMPQSMPPHPGSMHGPLQPPSGFPPVARPPGPPPVLGPPCPPPVLGQPPTVDFSLPVSQPNPPFNMSFPTPPSLQTSSPSFPGPQTYSYPVPKLSNNSTLTLNQTVQIQKPKVISKAPVKFKITTDSATKTTTTTTTDTTSTSIPDILKNKEEKTEYRVLVGKIHSSITDLDLNMILSIIGDFIVFERPKVANASYGVAKFLTKEGAERCVRLLDSYPLIPGPLEVRFLYYRSEQEEKLGLSVIKKDTDILKLLKDVLIKLKLRHEDKPVIKIEDEKTSPIKSEKTAPVTVTEKPAEPILKEQTEDSKKSAFTFKYSMAPVDADPEKSEKKEEKEEKKEMAQSQADKLAGYLKKKKSTAQERSKSRESSMKRGRRRSRSYSRSSSRSRSRSKRRSRSYSRSYSRSRSRSRSRSPRGRRYFPRGGRRPYGYRGGRNYNFHYHRFEGDLRPPIPRRPKSPPKDRRDKDSLTDAFHTISSDEEFVEETPRMFEIRITNIPLLVTIKFLNDLVIACGSPTPCKKNERGPGFLAQFHTLKRATMVAQHLNNWRVIDKILKVDVLADTKDVVNKISVVEDTAVAKEIESVFEEYKETFILKIQGEIMKEPDIFTFKIFKCCVPKCREYDCHYYHNPYDRRRDYLEFKYTERMCIYVKDNMPCPRGEYCNSCHTQIERIFHPKNYKTNICLDWYDLKRCPKRGFCSKAHPLNPDSFFTEAWKDCFVAGLDQSYFFFSGAIKQLYKVPGNEGGIPVMFITTMPEVAKITCEVAKPVARIHRLKIAIITDEYQDPGGAHILIGTPSGLANLVESKGSAPLGGLRVLILDDITTLMNNPHHFHHLKYLIESIYSEIAKNDTLCKVALSETCHPSEVAKIEEFLRTKMALFNPHRVDPSQLPAVVVTTPPASSAQSKEVTPKRTRPISVVKEENLSDWEEGQEASVASKAKPKSRERSLSSRSRSRSSSSSGSSSRSSSRSRSRTRSRSRGRKRKRSDSSDSDKPPKGEYSTFSTEMLSKMKQEEGVLYKEHGAAYDVYLEVPEMHPSYEDKYERFLASYKKKYNTTTESEHMTKMWQKYWKLCIENIKSKDWKRKKRDLLEKYKLEASIVNIGKERSRSRSRTPFSRSPSSPSSPPPPPPPVEDVPYDKEAFQEKQTHPEKETVPSISGAAVLAAILEISRQPLKNFSVEGAMDILEELSYCFGEYKEPAISLIASVRSLGFEKKITMDLISEEKNVGLMNKIFEKILNSCQTMSGFKADFHKKGIAWGLHLLNYARDFQEAEEVSPPKDANMRFDLNLFAQQTYNHEPSWIFETLEQSLEYVYGAKPSKEILQQMFANVSAIHANMASSAPFLMPGTSASSDPSGSNPGITAQTETKLPPDPASLSSNIPLTLASPSTESYSSYPSLPTPLVHAAAGLASPSNSVVFKSDQPPHIPETNPSRIPTVSQPAVVQNVSKSDANSAVNVYNNSPVNQAPSPRTPDRTQPPLPPPPSHPLPPPPAGTPPTPVSVSNSGYSQSFSPYPHSQVPPPPASQESPRPDMVHTIMNLAKHISHN